MSPPLRNTSLPFRLLLLFLMFFFNELIVYYLALAGAQYFFGLNNPQQILEGPFTRIGEMHAFLFVQALTTLVGFALTAMMFSVLESGEFKDHLRITNYPSLKLIGLTIVSILVAQFFIEFLIDINKSIPLPPYLSFLSEQAKKIEQLTEAMMNFTDIGNLILISVVMALIPAISEEFFFRGLLLGDLLKAKIRPAIAIPVTGFIFALSHGEFDNTIAIFALGSFLGYLYYVSDSLWLPITAHFMNNLIAVVAKYMVNIGLISKEVTEGKTPLYLTLISLAVFALLIFLFNKWKNTISFERPEETINETPIS